MRTVLPKVKIFNKEELLLKKKRLLIVSEGFEGRSLNFLSLSDHFYFDRVIVCKYLPIKESKYKELIKLVYDRSDISEIQELTFNRYDPFEFEKNLLNEFKQANLFDEIIVDISVMSKLMIIQILCSLQNYNGNVKVVYSEAAFYAPTSEEIRKHAYNEATTLPSTGIHDIVRTPLLTSVIMQKSPSLLIAFLSFNEQLVRALLSEFNPMHFILINSKNPYMDWREKAQFDIHKNIIKEYEKDNPIIDNLLERKSSTVDYIETFEILADLYHKYCVENRIVLAPTGTKMQALGIALLKMCCVDVHIEYPTPESYYVSGYSGSKVRETYQVEFHNLNKLIQEISNEYRLNE